MYRYAARRTIPAGGAGGARRLVPWGRQPATASLSSSPSPSPAGVPPPAVGAVGAAAAAASPAAIAKLVTEATANLRKGVVSTVARMLPPTERRAVVEQWAAEGDPTASKIKDAEKTVRTVNALMAQAKEAETKAVAEAERLKQWIEEREKIKPEEATHPMLGRLISDLGYKKVYCASIRQLGDVPIWESQRILRRDRAEAIATEKRKRGFPVKLPGIITLYALPDGSFKLLDGQHRLAALKLLADSGIVNKDSNYVLVEVFPLAKEAEAKQLFMEINSAQPVKLIDLPDSVRPDIKAVIDGAMDRLMEAHPDFFKISQSPKLPHVNVDNLRDALYQHHIVERHGLKTPEELLAWLDRVNRTLGEKQDKDWRRLFKGRNMDVIDKAVAKARKGKFFLGLDHTWLSWD